MSTPWQDGDAVLYLRRDHTDGEIAERLGISARDVQRFGKVSAAYQPNERHPDLSWSHHAIVFDVETTLRRALLEDAQALGLTTREFRSHAIKTLAGAHR